MFWSGGLPCWLAHPLVHPPFSLSPSWRGVEGISIQPKLYSVWWCWNSSISNQHRLGSSCPHIQRGENGCQHPWMYSVFTRDISRFHHGFDMLKTHQSQKHWTRLMAIVVASVYFLPVTWNWANLTLSLAQYSSGVSASPIFFLLFEVDSLPHAGSFRFSPIANRLKRLCQLLGNVIVYFKHPK